MGDLNFTFPPDLERWIEVRLADGRYSDASDYVGDLIRRDKAGMFMEPVSETPEYVAWVREQVEIGLASGICDKNAFEVLDEIKASRAERRG